MELELAWNKLITFWFRLFFNSSKWLFSSFFISCCISIILYPDSFVMIYLGVFYLFELGFFYVEDLTKYGLKGDELVEGGIFLVRMADTS